MDAYHIATLIGSLLLMLSTTKKGTKVYGAGLLVATLWTGGSLHTVTDTFTVSHGDIRSLVVSEAIRIDLDPDMALAYSQIESGHTNALGDGGKSHGPLQVMAVYHIPSGDPRDPRVSVRAGVAIIKAKLAKYGSPAIARLAYVCGTPTGCSKAKTAKVLRKWEHVSQSFDL